MPAVAAALFLHLAEDQARPPEHQARPKLPIQRPKTRPYVAGRTLATEAAAGPPRHDDESVAPEPRHDCTHADADVDDVDGGSRQSTGLNSLATSSTVGALDT